jgi:hypothetical protein
VLTILAPITRARWLAAQLAGALEYASATAILQAFRRGRCKFSGRIKGGARWHARPTSLLP